jgi:hypothetical protein
MDFKEIYKAPFENTWGIVFSSTEVWSLDFVRTTDLGEFLQDRIVKALNSEEHKGFYPEDDIEYLGTLGDAEILYQGNPIMKIRGWGHLTGIGGLNLDTEKAAKIQDDFGEWIVEKLKI